MRDPHYLSVLIPACRAAKAVEAANRNTGLQSSRRQVTRPLDQ